MQAQEEGGTVIETLLWAGLAQMLASYLLEHLRWLYVRQNHRDRTAFPNAPYCRHPFLEPDLYDKLEWVIFLTDPLIRFLLGWVYILGMLPFMFTSGAASGNWYWTDKPSLLRRIIAGEK